MAWRYVLSTNAGKSIGELRAFERAFNPAISATATASCRIRTDDPLWNQVAAGEKRLKVYDSAGHLRLYGPIVSDEESADISQQSVKITAADLSFELGKRFFAKDAANVGDAHTLEDAGAIAFAILASINADEATGITAGNTGSFVQYTITYLWKRALDAISELSGLEGSFEWTLRYSDGVAGAAPTVYLDLAAQLGNNRTQTVFFEYGTGLRNCASYSRVRTIDAQATRVWALGSGGTSSSPAYDTAAEGTYGRREDVVTSQDLADLSLLDGLAAAQVNGRKDPKIALQMTGNKTGRFAPRYGVDYVIGDLVSARIQLKGLSRYAAPARVWSAQVTIDELGNEQPTVTLTPGTP